MSAIRYAQRLNHLPPYLFAELDRAKRAAAAQGRDLIDFGVGDPDQPTPAHIIDALTTAARDPANHRYALDQGLPQLRQAIARWYAQRFHVPLDPEREILPLIGSKEGIAHTPLAFVDEKRVVLVPDPCYPPYVSSTVLAGGEPVAMPLTAANQFLPDLKAIPEPVWRRASVLFVNYPNNPTAATAPRRWFEELVAVARRHGVLVCHDAAYTELAFEAVHSPAGSQERPLSVLEIDGAKEIAVEFHSLSKTFNMTGWRIGWACGNAEAIAGLGKVKTHIDSGVFQAVQWAGIAALDGPQDSVRQQCERYRRRRDLLVAGLRQLGWDVPAPKASLYVWAPLPKRERSSTAFAQRLLQQADVVVTPGVGFGAGGEGYVRLALTVPEPRISEALNRLRGCL